MTKPKKSYEEVSQWTGKELRTMSRFLLAVIINALRCANASEQRTFDDAIQCTRALLEFYHYCRNPSHDKDTLNLMDDALRRFHNFKHVFLQYQAYKKTTEQSKELQKQVNKE
ncbi:hypothetical protein K440DRAFT_573461 [Wilcoxina mikolae CBS 423.85]|nr:hypothetical protein K440DRAFT_573461 [Wilcoxina mikolae CBS 423.85]